GSQRRERSPMRRHWTYLLPSQAVTRLSRPGRSRILIVLIAASIFSLLVCAGAGPAIIAAITVISGIRWKCLEPISKSSEEDNEARELDESEEVLGVILPADEDAALPLDPRKEAFDEPTTHVAA